MLNRLTRLMTGIVIAGSLTTLVWGQAAPAAAAGPQWKDQGESDIGLQIPKEQDPAKKLELLKKWEQQYPETAFQDQRTLMTTQALTALVLGGFGKPAGSPQLESGVKAAHQLLDGIDKYFSKSLLSLSNMKTVSADAWTKARTTSELQAHALLAYDATLKKDDATAEAEYKKVLSLDPNQAATSYELGATVIREMIANKDTSRYSEAIYDFAHALSVTGPNALPAGGKEAAENALKKYYSAYHGNTDGIDDVKKEASASALPPSGFHIQSVVEIEQAKEKDHAAWAAAHPDLDFWENIKAALVAQGDAYFTNLKDVGFPVAQGDSYKGPAMFKAKVVSQPDPKEILVSVDNVPTGDCILKFDDNIKGDIPAGTEVQFKGVVEAYTKDPYTLTLNVQDPKTDITGLPDDIKFVPDAAKPVRRRAGAKAAPKK